MFYSPVKLAVAGVVTWCVIWLITPVDVVGHIAPGAVIYAAVCYAFLVLGTLFAHRGRDLADGREALPDWSEPLDHRLFWGTAALGLSGMGLRLFDRLYLRGAQYSQGAMELRESLASSDVSILGALAGVVFPFCLLPLLLLIASRGGQNRFLLYIVAIAIFVLPMAESAFQLSRSFLIMTIGLAFATIVLTRFRGRPFNRKLLLLSLAGIVGLNILASAMFTARLEAAEREISDSVFDSVYAEYLQPNLGAREAINSGSDATARAYLSVLPNGMYYLSGVYEMSALWDRPDGQTHSYGQLLFLPIMRGVSVLFGIETIANDQDIDSYIYRIGVFQTFFGPLWVDFGWAGPLLMLIIGFLVQYLAVLTRRGLIGALPIYSFMTIVIFFMPVVNLIANGLGIFCIFAFSFFAFYATRASPRRGGNVGLVH